MFSESIKNEKYKSVEGWVIDNLKKYRNCAISENKSESNIKKMIKELNELGLKVICKNYILWIVE